MLFLTLVLNILLKVGHVATRCAFRLHTVFSFLLSNLLLVPSHTTVQQECIPQAILGTDVLCQAKSGMGKTAVFVLACLQQM